MRTAHWSLLAILLMLALPALSQRAPAVGVTDTQFHPQGQFFGPYQEYLAIICNPADQSLPINSGQVYNAARAWGISLVGYERAAKAEADEAGPTGFRIGVRVVQVLAISFTIADQFGAWEIGSAEQPARWKAAIPIVGVALPQAADWLKKNEPKSELPPESERLPPGDFRVPGRVGVTPGCVQFKVYGMEAPLRAEERNQK